MAICRGEDSWLLPSRKHPGDEPWQPQPLETTWETIRWHTTSFRGQWRAKLGEGSIKRRKETAEALLFLNAAQPPQPPFDEKTQATIFLMISDLSYLVDYWIAAGGVEFALRAMLQSARMRSGGLAASNIRLVGKKTEEDLDPSRVRAGKQEWRALKSNARAFIASQASRLEIAMASVEHLSRTRLEQEMLGHPLAGKVLRWVVLNLIDKSESCYTSAIYNDQGQLVDVTGESVDHRRAECLAVVHPVAIDDQQRQAWRQRLVELAIKQPFAQLERRVFGVADWETSKGALVRTCNRMVEWQKFWGIQRLGWELDEEDDEYGYKIARRCCKYLPGTDLTAVLPIDPGIAIDRPHRSGFQRLGAVHFENESGVRRAVRVGNLHPVVVSELLRDLELLPDETELLLDEE